MQLLDAQPRCTEDAVSPLSLPSPPLGAFRLQTDDLDEFRSWAETAQDSHWRVVHGSGPLGVDLTVLGGSASRLASCGMGLGQTVRGSVSRMCLHVVTAGTHRYKVGRRVLEAEPGTAVLIPPRLAFTRESQPGTLVSVECDDASLQAAARAYRGFDAPRLATALQALDLRHPAAAALRAALGRRLEMASSPDARARTGSESILLGAIAAHAQADDAASNPAGPGSRRLARLEEWIDAHVEEPITMARLCEVAGVGARALQKDFIARRDMSPMQFVTERRLAAAWRKLVRAGHGESVSQIALSVGLTHLGRFSQLYKRSYGELPSRTLQRCAK